MTENNIGYDVPISEVAAILDKSDRQVRRYVKERRLNARSIRIDGHIKLMFHRDEVEAFKGKFTPEGMLSGEVKQTVQESPASTEAEQSVPEDVTVIQAETTEEPPAAKYVIDVLRDQLIDLRKENRELHYQLEQRSGQVGFLQGQIEALQAEVKMLAPAPKPQEETIERKPWYRRLFARN
jgi:hypothetical protein